MINKRAFITDIVLIDIIDFSKLTSIQQLEIIEYLTKTYSNMIGKMLKDSDMRFSDLIEGYIPTGDGFFCILNKKLKGYGTILALNFSHLSDHVAKRYPYFKGIRVAVHTGEIYRFKDIMGSKNYIGDGLNDCSRYLQVKNYTVSTIMISDSAFKNLKIFLTINSYFNALLLKYGFKYSQMYEFRDKHQKLKKGCLVWLRDASIINLPNMHINFIPIKEKF